MYLQSYIGRKLDAVSLIRKLYQRMMIIFVLPCWIKDRTYKWVTQHKS